MHKYDELLAAMRAVGDSLNVAEFHRNNERLKNMHIYKTNKKLQSYWIRWEVQKEVMRTLHSFSVDKIKH